MGITRLPTPLDHPPKDIQIKGEHPLTSLQIELISYLHEAIRVEGSYIESLC